jgi:hypothetical protein
MLCWEVSGVLSSRRGDNTNRCILQPGVYGRAHGGTERIVRAVRQACMDFVFVAHPQLERSGEEGRERGDFLAHSWQRNVAQRALAFSYSVLCWAHPGPQPHTSAQPVLYLSVTRLAERAATRC